MIAHDTPPEPEYRGFTPKTDSSGKRIEAHAVKRGDNRKTYNITPGAYEVKPMTDQLISILSEKQMVLFHGYPVVVSTDENGPFFRPLDVPTLQVKISEVAYIWLQKTKTVTIEVELPLSLAKQTISSMSSINLPVVSRIVNAPTPFYHDDGTMEIVSEPGHHKASGYWVGDSAQHFPYISENPTNTEVLAALELLWEPFKDFPYVSNDDKAALIAALLTGVCRAALPTAPAFITLAPEQGSGKTLIQKAVCALTGGHKVSLRNFPSKGEVGKNLLATLMRSPSYIGFDNVTGELDDEKMATIITTPNYEDRLLTVSKIVKVSTRTLLFFSGNNVVLKGDLARRFLSISIDPNMEDPTTRKFELDPVDHILKNRKEIWNAALTILRAHNIAGNTEGYTNFASFEMWSKVILDCVNWLSKRPDITINIGSAVAIVKENRNHDPERENLESLLESIWFVRNGEPFMAREILDFAEKAKKEKANSSFDTKVYIPKHVDEKEDQEEWIAWANGLKETFRDTKFFEDYKIADWLTSHYTDSVDNIKDKVDAICSGEGGVRQSSPGIKFGKYLTKSAGRIVGRYRLKDSGKKRSNTIVWYIERDGK